MDHKHILYTEESGVATLTLNRPRKLNALTADMYSTLCDILEEVVKNNTVRVVVITGVGRAFSVGADIKSLEQGADKMKSAFAHSGSIDYIVKKILTPVIVAVEKPVIAAVNGIVTGGGLDIVCSCDIRIASDTSTYSSAAVKRGIIPTMGSTYFLPRLIGVDRACELIWTGETISAQEAERIGLVTKVVPHDRLIELTMDLATRLAKNPPLAIASAKRVLYGGLHLDFVSSIKQTMHEYSLLSTTEDHKEAINAFFEKRDPLFRGM